MGEEPPLDDGAGGTPFAGVLFLDADPFSSFTIDFGSWSMDEKGNLELSNGMRNFDNT